MAILKPNPRHRFSTGITAAVFCISILFGSFISPATATTCEKLEPGTLVKVKGYSAVYLLTAKTNEAGYPYRKYFPNAEVFYSWFENFSNVVELDPMCIDEYYPGGGITYRPGSYLIKTDVSPNVYAVGIQNKKHLIPNEQIAVALYGANWAKKVRGLSDVFDSLYIIGAPLTDNTPHEGMIVKMAGDDSIYFVMNGMYREVEPVDVAGLSPLASTLSNEVFFMLDISGVMITKQEIFKDPTQEGGLNLKTILPNSKQVRIQTDVSNFSVEIPFVKYRPVTYAVENLTGEIPGTRVRIQIDAEGTTYGNLPFEPFLIDMIPRDWWDANVVVGSNGSSAEIITMEEGPDKYLTLWQINDEFAYAYNPNNQDCPLVEYGEGQTIDSKLCEIKLYENEMKDSFEVEADVGLTYSNDIYNFSLNLPNSWELYKDTYKSKEVGYVKDLVYGPTETIVFGFEEQDFLFEISVYTNAQWDNRSEESPFTYIDTSKEYVFVWAHAQDSVSDIMAKRMQEVEGIIKTFATTI